MAKAKAVQAPEVAYQANTVLTTRDLDEVVAAYYDENRIFFDVETVATREPRPGRKGSDVPALDERTNRVLWIALAAPGRVDAIPMGHPGGPAQLERYEVLSALKPLFFSHRAKINQNVKFDILSLAKYWGELPPGPYVDLVTVVHLLNENLKGEYNLGALAQRYLDYSYAKLAKEGTPMDGFPFDAVARYVGLDAKVTQLIFDALRPRLEGRGNLEDLFFLENNVTEVVVWMKQRGALIDRLALGRLNEELAVGIEEVTKEIHTAAGHEFNIGSNPQLAAVLYDELGLPCKAKTGGGARGVDSKRALPPLVRKHPIVPLILKHRDLAKLQNTYAKGLNPFIEDDDRIRCSFNQNGTTTGRFSSSRPNLQNVPRQSEDEDAARIRSMFLAPPGHVLVVGDYKQIEARLMAHYAGPTVKTSKMLYAFNHNVDLHLMTAAGLFSKPIEAITKEERQAGKTANFLLIFGGGPNMLIQTGGYSTAVAEEMHSSFHATYPEIDRWSKNLIEDARKMNNPAVETLLGRRRRLPDLALPRRDYSTGKLRALAERQAVNAVIQGSAADFNKMAMVRVFDAIKDTARLGRFHIVLTVHDEIVLEVPEEDAEEGVRLLRDAMEGIAEQYPLRVPLLADIHYGPNWASAK